VYLVDTSGSMDDSRKKNQLLASLDKIEPDYLFAFDTEIRKPSPISCSALKNLPFNGGTEIGKCLHDMFERLKTYNEPKDKKKNFYFVTDAEDTITDARQLANEWDSCKVFHKNNGGSIYGAVVFIGKEGPCATALKEIFISINQTPDDKISETLEALAEQAKKLTKNEDVVNGIIKELKQIDVTSTQASEKLASLNTNIENEERNSENLGCQINEISKNIDGLEVEFEMLRLREEDYNAKLGLRQDPNAKLGLRQEDQKDWVEAKKKWKRS